MIKLSESVSVQMNTQATYGESGAQEAIGETSTDQVRHQFLYM